MIKGLFNKLFGRDAIAPEKSKALAPQGVVRVKKSGIKLVSDMGDGEEFTHVDFDVAICGGDVLARHMEEYRLNSSTITRDEYEETYRQWKIDELKSIIAVRRKRKQKVSHLVAELAELEKNEAA